MSNINNWTGERLETNVFTETTLEHLHRYAIAMDLALGKKVLDIACGNGYGSNLLAKNASHVTGVDINTAVINQAKKKYQKTNLEFIQGTVEKIPATDKQFDIVVSFETLEHTVHHEQMIAEIKRVLRPGGLLIISTPDKSNYSDKNGYKNPFHEKELYEKEFKILLNTVFANTAYYSQSSFTGSLIIDEQQLPLKTTYTGDFDDIQTCQSLPVMYWLALASDGAIPVVPTSLFQNSRTIAQLQYDHAAAIKKTMTYRTGNIILSPFKFIRRLFKK